MTHSNQYTGPLGFLRRHALLLIFTLIGAVAGIIAALLTTH